MKKPHILNRAMFNQGGTSAYGRGITSNLVSDEQRQRFNYGGRVGYANIGLVRPPRFTDNELFNDWGGLADIEVPDLLPGPYLTKPAEWTADDEDYNTNQERRQGVMDLEDPQDYQGDVIEKAEVIETKDKGDVMTDSDWMELLGPTEEQKKRTKGEAQLGLAAGALDVFSQPTIAKGMRAASPHLSKLAQTASADQKAREKAILQGKVLSKVYTDRAGAKGKADIELAEFKGRTGNPWTDFQGAVVALKDTDDAIQYATGETVTKLEIDKKTKEPIMPTGATPGKIFKHPTTKQYFLIDEEGQPQPINLQKYLKNLKLA